MNKKILKISEELKDSRSKKVIFVAHCILNENTRYLGGAFQKGAVDNIVDEIQSKGLGIVQMPCPEQKAWGGVLKRILIQIFDSKDKWIYKLRKIVLPIFIWNTKRTYRHIAEETVQYIKDYIESGFEVVGIIGIGGSPSCGVKTGLNIEKFVDLAANTKIADLNTEKMNQLVKNCLIDEKGLFINELEKELSKNNLKIIILEYSLISEMNGTQGTFKL